MYPEFNHFIGERREKIMPVSDNTRSKGDNEEEKKLPPEEKPSDATTTPAADIQGAAAQKGEKSKATSAEDRGAGGIPDQVLAAMDNTKMANGVIPNIYTTPDEGLDKKDKNDFSEFGRGLRIKLPEFWQEHPETWFQQVEAVFWRYAVSSEEMK